MLRLSSRAHLPHAIVPNAVASQRMTGCGCLVVIAAIVGLIVLFVRGSFDSGEPVAQSLLLLALAASVWHRERSAHQLERTRGA